MLAAALKQGYTVNRLYDLTKIDKWFLEKFKNITDHLTILEQYKGKVILIFSYYALNLNDVI